jgi:glycosyltransferase involved in cell wall biosynthesis
MALNGVEYSKFEYVSWAPSIWKALQEYKVDLYISSFPYVGILTLIEAMGSGTPVVIHKHIFSRTLSGIDVVYPEAPSWRFPEELFDICRNMTREKLTSMGQIGRMQYEKFHESKVLQDALQNITHPQVVPCDVKNFEVQNDEFAYWMSNQNSMKNLITKKTMRIIKRLIR